MTLATTIQLSAAEFSADPCAAGLNDDTYKLLILGTWSVKEQINGSTYEAQIIYRKDGTYTALFFNTEYGMQLGFMDGIWSINHLTMKHKITHTDLHFSDKEMKSFNNNVETILCIGTSEAKLRNHDDGTVNYMSKIN